MVTGASNSVGDAVKIENKRLEFPVVVAKVGSGKLHTTYSITALIPSSVKFQS